MRSRHTIEIVATQKFAHCLIKFILVVGGIELLCQRQAAGVVDIFLYILAKGSGEQRLYALAQLFQVFAFAIFVAETLLAAKEVVVNH